MGNAIVGERITIRRKALGLTLDDIASEIGVDKSTIQRYEKGTIEKLKLPVIEAIARVLKVNPAWLVGKSDDISPSVSSINLTTTDTDPQIDRILASASQLNANGLSKLGDYAEDLTENPKYQKEKH